MQRSFFYGKLPDIDEVSLNSGRRNYRAEITYYETKHDDKYFYNRGYCDFCGATFNEMYKLEYINMVDIVEYG